MRTSRNAAKLWMCTICAAVMLAGAAWAQMGPMAGMMSGGGAASMFRGVWSPVVGSGAEYQMQSTNQDAPKEVGISVVGKEEVNGEPGYWMEISSQDPRSGGNVYMKMLIVVAGGNTQSTKMIVQMAGRPPMEMDLQAMQAMQGMGGRPTPPPQSADISKAEQDMGSESVTVPAGTFTCEHYRNTEGDDAWISKSVSPWGLVKMHGHAGSTMELTKVVTNAHDMITGTPVQMQMPNMGGMGGPPQR